MTILDNPVSLGSRTSAEALREHMTSGRKAEHRDAVRAVLAAHPDSTAEELQTAFRNMALRVQVVRVATQDDGSRLIIGDVDGISSTALFKLADDVVEVRRRLAELKNRGEAYQSGIRRIEGQRATVTWRLREDGEQGRMM